MIENLLIISKDLLKAIELADFTTEDELYTIGVVRKIVFILFIELVNRETSYLPSK